MVQVVRELEREGERDDRAGTLTVTGGLERECCGEERITGGIPLAGLVPGPLPPANWQTDRQEIESKSMDRPKIAYKNTDFVLERGRTVIQATLKQTLIYINSR